MPLSFPPSLNRALAAVTPFAAAAALALPAQADTESWNAMEVRVPISDAGHGLPNSLRVIPEARFTSSAQGLFQLFLRAGPIWEVHPNLFLAAHGVTYSQQSPTGVHIQEHRLELEPNLRGSWGDFNWNDRNRLEFRWRDGLSYRYRNQLRIAYAPPDARWIPFVAEEAMISLSGAGFHQNRAVVGVGYQLSKDARLDVGYMNQALIRNGRWEFDHVVTTLLNFQPGVAPIHQAESAQRVLTQIGLDQAQRSP